MPETLRIGEYASLGTRPYFFTLQQLLKEPNWVFLQGTPAEVEQGLDRGELDVALASPLALAGSPLDYLVLPDLGYASRRHIRDVLLFSDMLLDDMDEMALSLPEGATVANALIRLVLGRYLQYQNQFQIGWSSAEGYLLAGDPALRERILARYAYVYDLGDLWKHYTQKAMIYYLWVVKKEALRKKRLELSRFAKVLKKALEVSRADWDRFALLLPGYEWIKRNMITSVWTQIDYDLTPAHFEGLAKFYEDCAEFGLIEEVPELEYFEAE